MILNKEAIMDFIPHRSPFLFIDSIEQMKHPSLEGDNSNLALKDLVGSSVVATYKVNDDLEIFKGHFPGNPILPGVIQIEMMAQASCFALYELVEDPKKQSLEVALLNVNNAKFRRPIRPGMTLKIESICTRIRPPIMSYDCQITCDGELMSQSEILASVKM